MAPLCHFLHFHRIERPYLHCWLKSNFVDYLFPHDNCKYSKWVAFYRIKRYGRRESKWIGMEAHGKKFHWIYLGCCHYLYLFVPHWKPSVSIQDIASMCWLLLLDLGTNCYHPCPCLEHPFIRTLPWPNRIHRRSFIRIFGSSSKHPVPQIRWKIIKKLIPPTSILST